MSTTTAAASWHHSLEEWTQLQFGQWRQIEHVRPVGFAPFEAHRPEPFHSLPVIMVVLGDRTRAFHSELVQAIDLIRISTATFRPVLFIDSAHSPAIAACDWPVEQCLPEVLVAPGTNWLEHATDHLARAAEFFGATYVFAPKNTEDAETLLMNLGLAFNAEPGVRTSAARLFAHAPTVRDHLGASARGAWDQLPAGPMEKTFESGLGEVTRVSINHVPTAPGILVSEEGEAAEIVDELAAATGWSSISAGRATPESSEFTAAVLNAGAEAMSSGGARILIGTENAAIASDAVLTPNDAGRSYLLHIGSRRLSFPAAEAPRVLASVSGLLRR